MSKIAIVTDVNSSITFEEAKERGIFLLNMPFMVNGEEYMEGENCTYEEFCEKLDAGADVSTSQPSPAALMNLWDEILKEYDEIVHIPMSSALSSACETATAMAEDYDGRVQVVNNQRISITQRQSCLEAMKLAENGMSAAQIKEKLEAEAFECSIYLAVNTLELLKKSGRITPSAATLATVLGIKPVLTIQGEKLDSYAKVRGMKKAEKTMLDALRNDINTRFAGKKVKIEIAYSGKEVPMAWVDMVKNSFADVDAEIGTYRLPVSICCHVSTGVEALGIVEAR